MKRPAAIVAGVVAALLLVLGGWWWVTIDAPGSGLPAVPAARPPLPDTVRIEVLNRSGVANMARVATTELRAGGLDVVYFGTADSSIYPKGRTRILVRGPDTTGLGRILDVLGVAQVEKASPDNRWVAFSVILGDDFHGIRTRP